MQLLLDTHTLLWFLADSPALPDPVGVWIKDPQNSASVSIISLWEIGIKSSIGKLPLNGTLQELADVLAFQTIHVAPITVAAIDRLIGMPLHHRDPFDRLLVATALTTGATLLSRDATLDSYGVKRAWG